MAKHCQLRSINTAQSVMPSETTDVCCWCCGEKEHYKRECSHKSYQYQKRSKKDIFYKKSLQDNKNDFKGILNQNQGN